MKLAGPIFLPSSLTPEPTAPGIALRGPSPGGSPRWLHGALVLDEADLATHTAGAWLGSLFVAAIPRDGDSARVAPLGGGRAFFQPHGKPCELPGGGHGYRLAFAFDLEAVLGLSLAAGRHHVFVSARHHRSVPVEIEMNGNAAEPAVFTDASPAKTTVDHLLQACALARAGEWARAVEEYAPALADPEVSGDLDGAYLYNAACAAARAVLADQGRDAEPRLGHALAWLREDLAKRRDTLARRLLAAFDAEVADGKPGEAQADAGELRASMLEHFSWARREDPDLETLRPLSGFLALFAGTPAVAGLASQELPASPPAPAPPAPPAGAPAPPAPAEAACAEPSSPAEAAAASEPQPPPDPASESTPPFPREPRPTLLFGTPVKSPRRSASRKNPGRR